MPACKTDLRKQLAHPKVAQPKLGAYSAPSLLLVSITHPARMPDGPGREAMAINLDGLTYRKNQSVNLNWVLNSHLHVPE